MMFGDLYRNPRDKGRKLKVLKMFIRRPGGLQCVLSTFKLQVGNYMFKFNNRNARTRCEICSKLTIKTPERP